MLPRSLGAAEIEEMRTLAQSKNLLSPAGLREWWYGQLHQWIPITKYRPYERDAGPHVTPKSQVAAGGGNGRDAPIPPGTLAGGSLPAEEYLSSGEEQVRLMAAELEKAGLEFRDGMRVVEFGCSSGRMTRWLHLLPARAEVYGCDIFAEAVRWARLNLNPSYRFLTTTSNPHLPFEDRSAQLIYAGSVFSHIYELAEAWLLELHRILADDGMAYLTIREKHEFSLFDGKMKDSMIAQWLREDPEARRAADSDFASLELGGFRNPNVFWDLETFREMVQPHLEVRGVVHEAYWGQTAVILARASRS